MLPSTKEFLSSGVRPASAQAQGAALDELRSMCLLLANREVASQAGMTLPPTAQTLIKVPSGGMQVANRSAGIFAPKAKAAAPTPAATPKAPAASIAPPRAAATPAAKALTELETYAGLTGEAAQSYYNNHSKEIRAQKAAAAKVKLDAPTTPHCDTLRTLEGAARTIYLRENHQAIQREYNAIQLHQA